MDARCYKANIEVHPIVFVANDAFVSLLALFLFSRYRRDIFASKLTNLAYDRKLPADL